MRGKGAWLCFNIKLSKLYFFVIFSVFAETTRCAMRDVLASKAPTCQLADIEPAVQTGLFMKYPEIAKCPCKAFCLTFVYCIYLKVQT